MEQTHYQPAVNAFNKVTGLNASNLPMGIKNAIWSIGVQHGSGGARSLFQRAGIKKGDSPATILNKIYNERMKVDIYFRSSTPEIKASVKNRFKKELQDALKQL